MSPIERLYNRGYTDLVCVAPPGAPIARASRLDENDLGKRPAKRGSHGWYGYGWIHDQPTRADVARWAEWGANVGLRGTRFPALDIDTEDPTLARQVRKLALSTLGPAPCRGRDNSAKELLVYRTKVPFSRVAVEIASGSPHRHLVEFLGDGRQYLVYGDHPSGTPYKWLKTPLWEVEPSSLTEITVEQVEDFLELLGRTLTEQMYSVQRVGRAKISSEDIPPQVTLVAPSLEVLREAVAHCPNVSPDRDDYIEFGCAVKAASEGEEEGYEIFAEWAARWEGGDNDPDTVRSDWRRMHPPFRVGYGWILEQAEGFNSAVWEFDADPTAVPDPVSMFRNPEDGVPVHLTDDWLAEQIVPALAKTIRYDYPNARWHFWDGAKWAIADRGQQERAVIHALRRLATQLRERTAGASESERKAMRRTISKLGNRSVVASVTGMLQSHSALAVGTDAFDTEDMQLNTPGGVVDLHTGNLGPHDGTAMHSRCTAVTPGAGTAPVWTQFLEEVTLGNKELQRFLQKSCGYALTGVRREQTLNFIWGPGGNGKSVFLDALLGVMGDYAATASMDTFASSRGDKHPTDMAGLMGARLVTASETQAGRSWDEQRLKAITGGDRIRARFMRQDFVEFTPRFKLIFVGNHEPRLEHADEAMRRRIHIIPFTFKPKTPDLNLTAKLKAEYPAILRWMIDGCLMWQTEGLVAPEIVLAQTNQYFEDEDLIGQWFKTCCKREPSEYLTRKDAYQSWSLFCMEHGEKPGTLRAFRKLVRPLEVQHGFVNGLVGPDRLAGWSGVALAHDPTTFGAS